MKKTLLLLSIVTILTAPLLAKTSSSYHEKLIEEYMDVSGQGYAFKKIPTQMVNMIDQQYAALGTKAAPEVRTLLIEGLTKESTVNNMLANIKKIPSENLSKLIAFYKTKLGQKCMKLNKSEDMDNIQEELPLFAKRVSENPPSEDRIKSMNTMFIETNILTSFTSMMESIVRIFNANAPKKEQMNNAQIEEMMNQMGLQMNQQLIITFYYALRNFSDEEVKEIVKVTLSPEGQSETDAQLADMLWYFTTVSNDLVVELSKLNR